MAFQNGAEVFFFRYHKIHTVLSIVLLLYFPFEVYRGVDELLSNQMAAAIGTFANAAIVYLFVPIYMIVQIRRAIAKQKQDVAEAGRNKLTV